MSTNKLGNRLREIRLDRKLPLRKVAALADIDVAILSKMERGERRLTKEIIGKLASIYKADLEELMILYLSDRVLFELSEEPLALSALKAAEAEIEYRLRLPAKGKEEQKKAIIQKMQAYLKSQKLVTKAWIFGSFARGDDTPQSDIDLLVRFDHSKRITLFDVLEITEVLGKETGRKIDIVEEGVLLPFARKTAEKDLITIYG